MKTAKRVMLVLIVIALVINYVAWNRFNERELQKNIFCDQRKTLQYGGIESYPSHHIEEATYVLLGGQKVVVYNLGKPLSETIAYNAG